MSPREMAIILAIFGIAMAGTVLYWRGHAIRGWGGKSVRICGVFVILFAGVECLHWARLRGGRMPAPVYTVESPDAQSIAEIVEPDGDLLLTRLVRVSVRRAGNLFAIEVFAGPAEPNVEWLNNRTLRLTYPATGEKPKCGGLVSGLSIACNEVPAKSFKPRDRE
jgi:hypothetical protein